MRDRLGLNRLSTANRSFSLSRFIICSLVSVVRVRVHKPSVCVAFYIPLKFTVKVSHDDDTICFLYFCTFYQKFVQPRNRVLRCGCCSFVFVRNIDAYDEQRTYRSSYSDPHDSCAFRSLCQNVISKVIWQQNSNTSCLISASALCIALCIFTSYPILSFPFFLLCTLWSSVRPRASMSISWQYLSLSSLNPHVVQHANYYRSSRLHGCGASKIMISRPKLKSVIPIYLFIEQLGLLVDAGAQRLENHCCFMFHQQATSRLTFSATDNTVFQRHPLNRHHTNKGPMSVTPRHRNRKMLFRDVLVLLGTSRGTRHATVVEWSPTSSSSDW